MTSGPGPSLLARLRQHRGARIALEVAWVLAIVLAVSAFQARGHLDAGTAPELTLPSLDGAPVSLAALRGRPAMLVFWAPWCGVCKAQADNVERVRRLAGARAHVVTIAASFDDLAEVRREAGTHGDAPVLLADDATVKAFRVDAFPTVYFLDREGRVKRSAAGYTSTLGMLLRLAL